MEISIEKSLFPHGNEAAFLLLEALDRFSDGIVYQASFRRRNDKLALLEPVGRSGSARILAREKTDYTERKYGALPTRMLFGAKHVFCTFPVLRSVLNGFDQADNRRWKVQGR